METSSISSFIGITQLVMFLGTAYFGFSFAGYFPGGPMIGEILSCFVAADLTYLILAVLSKINILHSKIGLEIDIAAILEVGLYAAIGCLAGMILGGLVGGYGSILGPILGGLGAVFAVKQ